MAEVSRSAATLRIFGDDLDPAWVTKKLGSEPSFSVRKGEVQAYPPGRKVDRIARTGIWRITAPREEPADLDRQITFIFSRLSDDIEVWSEMGRRFSIDLFCGLWLEEPNEGASLSPKSSLILGERGILLSGRFRLNALATRSELAHCAAKMPLTERDTAPLLVYRRARNPDRDVRIRQQGRTTRPCLAGRPA